MSLTRQKTIYLNSNLAKPKEQIFAGSFQNLCVTEAFQISHQHSNLVEI